MHGSAEASLRLANLSNALALDEGTREAHVTTSMSMGRIWLP